MEVSANISFFVWVFFMWISQFGCSDKVHEDIKHADYVKDTITKDLKSDFKDNQVKSESLVCDNCKVKFPRESPGVISTGYSASVPPFKTSVLVSGDKSTPFTYNVQTTTDENLPEHKNSVDVSTSEHSKSDTKSDDTGGGQNIVHSNKLINNDSNNNRTVLVNNNNTLLEDNTSSPNIENEASPKESVDGAEDKERFSARNTKHINELKTSTPETDNIVSEFVETSDTINNVPGFNKGSENAEIKSKSTVVSTKEFSHHTTEKPKGVSEKTAFLSLTHRGDEVQNAGVTHEDNTNTSGARDSFKEAGNGKTTRRHKQSREFTETKLNSNKFLKPDDIVTEAKNQKNITANSTQHLNVPNVALKKNKETGEIYKKNDDSLDTDSVKLNNTSDISVENDAGQLENMSDISADNDTGQFKNINGISGHSDTGQLENMNDISGDRDTGQVKNISDSSEANDTGQSKKMNGISESNDTAQLKNISSISNENDTGQVKNVSDISGDNDTDQLTNRIAVAGDNATGQFNNTIPDNATENAGHCKICAMQEERKKFRIEQIKRNILFQLRLTSVPNVTAKSLPDVSPIMDYFKTEIQSDSMDRYYRGDDDKMRVERIIIFGKPLVSEEHQNNSGGCHFSMTNDIMSLHVRQAVLWLFLDPDLDSLKSKEDVLLYVYAIGGKSKHDKLFGMEWLHYRKIPSRKAAGWIDVDLTKIVHRWIKHQGTNRGLILEALNEKGRNIISTPVANSDGSDDEHVPFLDIRMAQHRRRRKRQAPNICSNASPRRLCCRYPLTVNFLELEWYFVIAPAEYISNFCAGDCDIDSGLDAYPFTTMAHRNEVGHVPCCAPTKMGSMPMLYRDQNGSVHFSVLPNMSVKSCACT